jgi:hypothetical protein
MLLLLVVVVVVFLNIERVSGAAYLSDIRRIPSLASREP